MRGGSKRKRSWLYGSTLLCTLSMLAPLAAAPARADTDNASSPGAAMHAQMGRSADAPVSRAGTSPAIASQAAGPAHAPIAAAAVSAVTGDPKDPPQGAKPQENAVLSARLPIVVEGRRFQTVLVTATVSEVLTISPAALAESLRPILSDAAREQLIALGSGQFPVATLGELGYLVRLNPQNLSVAVDVQPALRAVERFSLIDIDQYPESKQIYPGNVAAGLTATMSVVDNSADGLGPTGRLGFFGFANVGGMRGVNIDYGGTFDIQGSRTRFQRDAILAFVDRPEQALRYSAGDLFPALPALAGSSPFVGISLQRNYQLLQPARIIRPTGRRSFLLEKAATVEVYSNGTLINRFAAGPGPIDLADIPVANITNNIEIVVEDALGRRELDSFALANDVTLLGAGLDEFSVSAGFLRDPNRDGYAYSNDWVMAAGYMRGVSERLTLGAHAAITEELQNAGASAAFAGLGGVILVEGAASRAVGDRTGFAASIGYRGGNFLPSGTNDVLTARLDYSSAVFSTLADPTSSADDRWRAAVDYRFNLTEETSALVGATYADRHSVGRADKFVTAGINHRIGRLQASVTGRLGQDALGRTDAGAFFTLSMIFGDRTIASASYDTLTNNGRVEFSRSRRAQAPDYSYRVGVEGRPGNRQAFGQAAYTHSRFEADARLIGNLESEGVSRGRTAAFRLQTGLAFADGTVALGRDPGRGFYMVRRHPSLEAADLVLYQGRSQNLPLATSGTLGPAIAPVNSPYLPTELTVVANNVPTGYDVGDTRFVVLPGARSGVVIDIGSDAFRWRLATLYVEGEPVDLNYGELVNVATGTSQSFFTNATGRARFAELAPGEYEIRLAGRAFRGRFTVLNSDAPFIDMGVINLERIP